MNYSHKRKPKKCKPKFIQQRNSNARKMKLSKFCKENDLEEYEVDTSKKILPNLDCLQVVIYSSCKRLLILE